MKCRSCDSERTLSVLDLGSAPPGDRFLSPEEIHQPEMSYPLRIHVCEDCLLLQGPSYTPRDGSTPHHPRTDLSVREPVTDRLLERTIHALRLGPDSLIFQVASSDGYLLRHAVEAGIPCLGIEPSARAGTLARAGGVPTITAFLDEDLAEDLYQEYGPADLVVADDIYSYVSDIPGFTRALRILVADHGTVSMRIDHALPLIRNRRLHEFEHGRLQYYTLHTAMRALAAGGLTVVEVKSEGRSGESLRLLARPTETSPYPGPRVEVVLQEEIDEGLHSKDEYLALESYARATRAEILELLLGYRGQTVVGYASGWYSTLFNYCGIRPDIMRYTVDPDPRRHGSFTPITHVPVRSPTVIDHDRPDVLVALPWTRAPDPVHDLEHVVSWGGRLVLACRSSRSASENAPVSRTHG